MAKEICADCEKVFEGGKNAFLCPECRKRRVEEGKKRRRKKKGSDGMDEIKRAMLGDKEAQRAVTDRGELLPCYRCGWIRIALKHNGFYYYECCECGARSRESCVGSDCIKNDWNTRQQLLTSEEMERLEGLE